MSKNYQVLMCNLDSCIFSEESLTAGLDQVGEEETGSVPEWMQCDPDPHGDLFGDLGPLFMFWVPFFNFRLKNVKNSCPYWL